MLKFLSENEARILIKVDNQCDKWHVYANSADGRSQIFAEQPSELVTQIMAVWGDVPTVDDPIPDFDLALPTPQEDADALLVDHEYRLTLLELGVT